MFADSKKVNASYLDDRLVDVSFENKKKSK